MRAAEIAVRLAMPGIMALLAVYAGEAAAQAYSPQALERFEAAPPLALQLSPSGMRELDELHGVDMFGGKRRVDPFERSLEQRPQAWMLFGRLGVINYQEPARPRRRQRRTIHPQALRPQHRRDPHLVRPAAPILK